MICNKCGHDNPDDAMLCQACGHKLQSGWRGREARDEDTTVSFPPIKGMGPAARKRARLHTEAWIVALGVWCAAYGLLLVKLYWPLYPLTVLAGIYAWLRGITWKD